MNPKTTLATGPFRVSCAARRAFQLRKIIALFRGASSMRSRSRSVAAFAMAFGLLTTLVSPPSAEARRAVSDGPVNSSVAAESEWPYASACSRQRAPRSAWRTPLQWGETETALMEPDLASCKPDGRSTLLAATHVTDLDEESVYAGVLLDRRASRGKRRRVETSFLIPEETMPRFDHLAAFVAWDEDDPWFRRIGAAVFPHDLAIEIEDRDCGGGSNLFAFVPLSESLEPDRWYRLEVALEPLGEESLMMATLIDVASGAVLATTGEVMSCNEPWHSTSPMATGFMAIAPRADADPEALVLVDDFVALSKNDRRPARLAGRGY